MKNFDFTQPPFSPVRLTEKNGAFSLDVWGRTYGFDKGSALFSSILSQGEEILAAPIRVVMEENEEKSVWTDTQIFAMDSENAEAQTVCATASSQAFYLNTVTTAEFDGFCRIQLRIVPRGYTVREEFFAGERKPPEFRINKLWLEIPIKKSSSLCYQMYPLSEVTNEQGEIIKPNTTLSTGDFVHDGVSCYPFKAQYFLTGERTGIGVLAESDEYWQPISSNRAIECVNGKDSVTLRLRLLDSHPKKWGSRGGKIDIKAFKPLTFELGIQVTPVKEFPKNPYEERSVHIDCFKKISENYEDYLSKSFVKDNGTDTKEICLDRLARLGVNTLYLHEKWNDLQNSTLLTHTSADRLRYILSECKKRDIRVAPYFGYEISSLSPKFSERANELESRPADEKPYGMWNRIPYQRALPVCAHSSHKESFPRELADMMDRYGFCNIYLDSIMTPRPCANPLHGCGYTDADGITHPTYPVFAIRELYKSLYREVHLRGGRINSHNSAAYTLSALAFCDSIWEGEVTQFAMFNDMVDRMPEGIYRGQFDGRIFGIPLLMLAYTDAPKWTHEHSTAFASLLGTFHKPNDADEPLESTARLWKIVDDFDVTTAEWHPYWRQNPLVTCDHEQIRISYYQRDNELLVFVSNIDAKPAESVRIKANGTIRQVLPTEQICQTQTSPEAVERFGYRVYLVRLN